LIFEGYLMSPATPSVIFVWCEEIVCMSII